MARDNFIFYRSFFEGVDNLPQKNQLALYKSIIGYALDGKEPELNGIEKAIFSLIRPQLDNQPVSSFSYESRFHWNWKGGISTENLRLRNSVDYKKWRLAVFKRDNYTCKKCGKKGGALNAHHIKPFSQNKELIFNIDNGITLCKNCHKYIHQGIKNGKK